jgi:hypothetical protein
MGHRLAARHRAHPARGGLKWLGRGVYYPAGSLHAASDARQDVHAFERASGPNVHGGFDAFVGRGYAAGFAQRGDLHARPPPPQASPCSFFDCPALLSIFQSYKQKQDRRRLRPDSRES